MMSIVKEIKSIIKNEKGKGKGKGKENTICTIIHVKIFNCIHLIRSKRPEVVHKKKETM